MIALPPAQPPARTVAGVHVTWPLHAAQTTLAPGTKLRVRVSSSRRSAQLAFARVDGAGRVMRTVARSTLKHGTFTATVPAGAGARYALRLTVARTKRFAYVVASSAPVPPQGSGCTDDPAVGAEVAIDATSVAPGDSVIVTLTNTGTGELVDQGAYAFFRDGVPGAVRQLPERTDVHLAPTQSVDHEIAIPSDLAPGSYTVAPDPYVVGCLGSYQQYFQSPDFQVVGQMAPTTGDR